MLGILVGLKAEARLIRPFFPKAPIALSGATADGAREGTARLVAAGATRLLSFGCAAGLAPGLLPGQIVVPEWVQVDGRRFDASAVLRSGFGAERSDALAGGLLHSDSIIRTAAEKAELYAQTDCVAVDMESGFVARSGLDFAVLRVVCDDSRRDLPPVACDVLAEGRIAAGRLFGGLMRDPAQIGGLIALGRDAARARSSLDRFLQGLSAQGVMQTMGFSQTIPGDTL
ncbi:nucleoside phosphorylase-I family protein [Swaminathania salitolerans]|uniref:Nucleoside phosphorylase domain-containing protein n=1 Tax=Swaminathania salitolerans TaxID=182838 RepID=A0A511BT69_9PROT|nr:hypothetical protein [Swaminathania salitolerans]GBQ13382.1 hypothetical protein AA21291_1489 [Swaminathania salitolerans LMG 21291]GEL03302.1 hypothetical protein SSA02_24650 [Swaminathania salitolerans]